MRYRIYIKRFDTIALPNPPLVITYSYKSILWSTILISSSTPRNRRYYRLNILSHTNKSDICNSSPDVHRLLPNSFEIVFILLQLWLLHGFPPKPSPISLRQRRHQHHHHRVTISFHGSCPISITIRRGEVWISPVSVDYTQQMTLNLCFMTPLI